MLITIIIRWYMNLAGTELPLMTNQEMVERMTSSGDELVTITNIHTSTMEYSGTQPFTNSHPSTMEYSSTHPARPSTCSNMGAAITNTHPTSNMSRGMLSLGNLDKVFKVVWWRNCNYHLYRRSKDWAN